MFFLMGTKVCLVSEPFGTGRHWTYEVFLLALHWVSNPHATIQATFGNEGFSTLLTHYNTTDVTFSKRHTFNIPYFLE